MVQLKRNPWSKTPGLGSVKNPGKLLAKDALVGGFRHPSEKYEFVNWDD